MPLIQIQILEGRTVEQKEAMMAAVTKAVHESIEAPLSTIRVWIHELAPEHYMVAGRLKAEN